MRVLITRHRVNMHPTVRKNQPGFADLTAGRDVKSIRFIMSNNTGTQLASIPFKIVEK